MSSCHKHQQQRYHNENNKSCMFIHYMYVDVFFPLTKAIPIMFEHDTTHYQTLQTSISHDATRYHNFNALPHALPHVLPYIFSKFRMVWGYLQRVTTRYHQIYKKIYINIFLKKMTVTRGNALQIAQNKENLRKNIR